MPKPDDQPADTPEPGQPKTDPTKTGTPESRVRAVYSKLTAKKRTWIKLYEVRALLGDDLPREEVNKTLLAMQRTGYVHLAPDSDTLGLTQADHDAAIRIGKEDKHFLFIEEEE